MALIPDYKFHQFFRLMVSIKKFLTLNFNFRNGKFSSRHYRSKTKMDPSKTSYGKELQRAENLG